MRRVLVIGPGGAGESTLDVRLAACNAAVFLDFPRRACLWRVMMRWIRHAGRERPDLPAGCPERVRLEFLLWIWTYPKRRRGEILRQFEAVRASKTVALLRSDAEVERFVAAARG